ncbi:RNA-directed DNA polymerase, eukaryota [Tanacetum coccineum]
MGTNTKTANQKKHEGRKNTFYDPSKEAGTFDSRNSFVNVLKGTNMVKETDSSPVIVLEEDCLNSKDLSNSLIGRVKDVGSLSNLKKVLCNEGFDNIFVRYMGELWVLLEFDNTKAKELFRDNVGVGSWFSVLRQASHDFTPEGRIAWVKCIGFELKKLPAGYPSSPMMRGWMIISEQESSGSETVGSCVYILMDEDNGASEGSMMKNPSLNYLPGSTPRWMEKNGSQSKDDQVHSDSIGNSGGILCIWDPNSFRKDSVTVSDYFVIVCGVWIKSGMDIYCCGYYAPMMLKINGYYGIYLSHVSNQWAGEVVMMGDFNEVLRGSSWMEVAILLVFSLWFDVDGLIIGYEFLERCPGMIQMLCDTCVVVDVLKEFLSALSKQQKDLECMVSKEEVKRAVWDCGTDKSPGPDGFTFGFYRHFWSTIENDVFEAIKFIAKILTNRLVGVLGDIVNEVQSAFISERQILDGPFILNEIMQWCRRRKKQSLIFKVDFEKAYDSVRWDFLDDILVKFGFGIKWRGWIQNCLNSSKGSILVNGSPTEEFQFYKGLKQGDPLSPFLFILVMESLHISFQRVVDVGMFTGIKLSSSLNISHLFYADDAIFLGQWNDSNIDTLVHVMECFLSCLGGLITDVRRGFDLTVNSIVRCDRSTESRLGLARLPFSSAGDRYVFVVCVNNSGEFSVKSIRQVDDANCFPVITRLRDGLNLCPLSEHHGLKIKMEAWASANLKAGVSKASLYSFMGGRLIVPLTRFFREGYSFTGEDF